MHPLLKKILDPPLLGSLRNDDDGGDENGKKSNRFRQAKQQRDARASRFLVHFSAVVARLQRDFADCRGREQKTTTFFFFS